MKSDFHLHTEFSSDSEADQRDMVKQAIQLGLRTICFTDHFDMDYPDYGNGITFALDTDSYMKKVRLLQKEYAGKLKIRVGVELGMQPHLVKFYEEYVNRYPFDFVIGSVHMVDGQDPYFGDLFQRGTDEASYRRYFEVTLENVKINQEFDVLGHMDYLVRYGTYKDKYYSYERYQDLIDEILKELIYHGKGIELNTASFRNGLSFSHPHPDVIKRYRELGGEIITVGSDAHKPEQMAWEFQRAAEVLVSCGFQYYTEFQQRNPYFCPLT